jgi:MoaA/NifB/PqqE/SkfB family radical SAM enzyme
MSPVPGGRREYERQEPPFALQVELTEGCNLRCQFCGLNGIRGKDNNLKFMTPGLALVLCGRLAESGWSPRVEFAMHGEPSLNPEWPAILAVFRKGLPGLHMMMTSNGAGFVRDPTASVDAALTCLNVLALDWYEGVALVPKILDRYGGAHPPSYYPDDDRANPHRRRGRGEHDFVIVRDISVATKGTHSVLNNHAGCGAPKNRAAAGRRCAQPFRELSVRWDGSVAICCNDWRGEYRCGDVTSMALEEIWQGPAFGAARRKLYHGMRDFGPCDGCDALSYRTGLLPDKMGKQTLPVPDAADESVICGALGRGPYTLPVLRPWELKG